MLLGTLDERYTVLLEGTDSKPELVIVDTQGGGEIHRETTYLDFRPVFGLDISDSNRLAAMALRVVDGLEGHAETPVSQDEGQD